MDDPITPPPSHSPTNSPPPSPASVIDRGGHTIRVIGCHAHGAWVDECRGAVTFWKNDSGTEGEGGKGTEGGGGDGDGEKGERDQRYEGRDLEEGEIVVVEAEGKEEACMIGQLRVGTREIKEKKKGVVIDSGHYLGDGLWRIELD